WVSSSSSFGSKSHRSISRFPKPQSPLTTETRPPAAMMERALVRFLVLILAVTICGAASVFQPISDSHRSAALDVFVPVDGSYKSLEEAYEALKTLEILGIDKKSDLSSATCENVVKVLASPSSSTLKDVFYALSVNGILKCKSGGDVPKDIVSKLQTGVKDAKLLLDFYYSVRGLVLVKEQFSGTDISLGDAEAVFRSIKALSQSDGKWRYSPNNPESSTFAAGLAFETLAGVISLAPSEIDHSLIQTLKTGITKLFDSIQKYDDGTFYFDESEGPISTTASVIRGLKSFAASESTGLNLPGDKIVGLAKFFLGVGIPGDAKDFFNQIDALACLEDNRFSVPLILSLPSTVISLTKKEPLKVKVSTVFGSKAPALSVKLAQALSSGSKGSSVINNQELKFDAESATYFLESFPKNFDVGKYTFVFEILLDESTNEKVYITEAQTKVPISATGAITIENAEIAVLDSDVGSVESQKKLDLTKDEAVSLSANHLQKLRLSLQLTTPLGHVFKPHQAFLKLKHESLVEHIFLVKTSGKKSELVLDFLGLVEKLYYLSGKYEIQLTIGDASMENSLLSNIGHIELDLPERPEKAARPPLQPTDPYSRYVPKAEISHIFRVPEKLPAKQLSLVFLGLIVLPFIGFLIGLTRLGVNIKSFPSSVGAATSALLFHGGIGAVLLLYVLFWVKASSQNRFLRAMSYSAAGQGNNSSGKRRISDLLTQSDNRVCADCSAPDPKWASANIGVFICLKCCGVHRSLGTHISKVVLSVTLDEWSDDEVDSMIEIGGNASANSVYEAFIPDGVSKPGPDASHDQRMQFIRSKYEHQEFLKPSLRITSVKGSNSSSSQQPHLEGMVEFIGLLKVTLKKGTNLAVRDTRTSDSYVVLTLGQQTAKSTVMKSNLNPVWNEELMLSVPHDYGSVKLVLSVTLDEWSDDEVDSMIEIGGNASANSIYEAFIPDGVSKPGPDASHDQRMRFIRSKYEHQEYLKPSLRITSVKGPNSSSSQQPHLEGMVEFIGLLKVTLKKGTNLAVRDMRTSDAYVVLTLGQQTAQSTVMKSNLNPVWNEELMLSVPHDYGSVKLQVFDYDTFSADDIMGEAGIDIQPLITSVMAFGDPEMFGDMQIGKWLKSCDNALIEDSIINIVDGKVKQEVHIKLQNVESGELELELEWLPLDQ
ncbi:unnamed protein product, partial [Brassica rapa subsp. narinosa]